jgi:NAD(P)-dependent dehydrogenase (short-subunit alcohol dehydrogenase family)
MSNDVTRREFLAGAVAVAAAGTAGALIAPAVAEAAPLRVNAVCPGVVRTELWRDLAEADRNVLFESAAESLPVGRVGEPRDVAEAYLYLMRGAYTTGSVVVVDGGTVLV